MIFSILKNINLRGKLDIIDFHGKKHSYGKLDTNAVYSKIRFTISSEFIINQYIERQKKSQLVNKSRITNKKNSILSCFEEI